MDGRLRRLIEGERGGPTRARIVNALHEHPRNINQLADDLGLHYKTVRQHVDILTEARVLTSSGEQYGVVYLPTEYVREHWRVAEQLIDTAVQSDEK